MKLLLLFSFMLLSACATTNITGFTDPDYKTKTYKSLVVVTPNLNLEYSSLLQGKVCDAMHAVNVACRRGLDIFPPTAIPG